MSVGLVLHVPHASLIIPDEYRQGILLSAEQLAGELVWSTDAYCDELFTYEYGVSVVAEYSRLACDVERFRDDALEAGAKNGNGLLYTHTQRGAALRKPDGALREKALREIYDPHHKRLAAAVDEALKRHGQCLIVDAHSFCDDPAVGDNLPDFCIGSDIYHTPEWLVGVTKEYLERVGCSVAVNYPYRGAMVPHKHFRKDNRVYSLMIEVNKRLYLNNGTLDKSDEFKWTQHTCAHLLRKYPEDIQWVSNQE